MSRKFEINWNWNKSSLAVEQNNYLNKFLNVYIVYDLNA